MIKVKILEIIAKTTAITKNKINNNKILNKNPIMNSLKSCKLILGAQLLYLQIINQKLDLMEILKQI